MAFVVAHCEKYQASNIGAIERHEERLNDNYSNKNIDKERIKDNFYPCQLDHKGSYSQRIKAIFAKYDIKPWDSEKRTGYKANSVVMAGWIIGAGAAFFQELGTERTKAYFKTCVDYFADKLGRDKIINAVVHMDEDTPHLHLSYVPVLEAKDKNGYRLSCKDLHTRKFLREIQDELPKYLNARGFNVERGIIDSGTKHKTPQQFKKEQAQLQEELKPTLAALKGLEAGERTREGIFRTGAEMVKIPAKVYDSVVDQLEKYGAAMQEILRLQAQITRHSRIKEQKAKYKAEVEELKQLLGAADEEIQKLKSQQAEAYTKGIEAGRTQARKELDQSYAQLQKMIDSAKQVQTNAEKTKAETNAIYAQWQDKLDDIKARSKSIDDTISISGKLALYGTSALAKWIKAGKDIVAEYKRQAERNKGNSR